MRQTLINTETFSKGTYDKTGMFVAVLCALHCLLLPVLLPAVALTGLSLFGVPWLELLVLFVSLAIGGVALSMGYKRHANLIPFSALGLGAILFLFKHEFYGLWEVAAIICAALLLVYAHVSNLYLSRQVERKASCC